MYNNLKKSVVVVHLQLQYCDVFSIIRFLVSNFLTENPDDSIDLNEALDNPPQQRTDVRYIHWIAKTKGKVKHVLNKDPKVPRLLNACLRHLEVHIVCIQ